MKVNLNHLGEKWLELKKQRMQNLLKIAPPDEAFYREIMLSHSRLTKAFKTKYPDLKITTLKRYMGVIFLRKPNHKRQYD